MIRSQPWFTQWREAARNLKGNVTTLYFAFLDPATPLHAKAFALLVVAYALSPIDLIPDPIPVLGYLDDLILLPLGIWFALRLIPPDVLVEARRQAAEHPRIDKAWGRVAAAAIILIYILIAVWLWRIYFRPLE